MQVFVSSYLLAIFKHSLSIYLVARVGELSHPPKYQIYFCVKQPFANAQV